MDIFVHAQVVTKETTVKPISVIQTLAEMVAVAQ